MNKATTTECFFLALVSFFLCEAQAETQLLNLPFLPLDPQSQDKDCVFHHRQTF